MPTSYDDIPPDRRQQYLDKAEAAAREAHQKVVDDLGSEAVEANIYATDEILRTEPEIPKDLDLSEQIVYDTTHRPDGLDVGQEAEDFLAKRETVHAWLKNTLGTDDLQQAIYQFSLKKAWTDEQRQDITARYEADPKSLELDPQYYKQIREIIQIEEDHRSH